MVRFECIEFKTKKGNLVKVESCPRNCKPEKVTNPYATVHVGWEGLSNPGKPGDLPLSAKLFNASGESTNYEETGYPNSFI